MSALHSMLIQWRGAVQRLWKRPQRPLIFHSALLALLLATFLLASAQVRAYTGVIQRDAFTIGGAIPAPTLRYTPPASQRLPVVAVLAHGYSADKELMSAFAVDLAKQGITVYTFDFPGHGASTVPYNSVSGQGRGVVSGLGATLSEVVDYALAHAPPQAKLVLLGYSLGTIPVDAYSMAHASMTNLAATVLVAGIFTDRPAASGPRNLLVLSGQFDLPGINDIARNAIAGACSAPLARVTGSAYQCTISATDSRERIILPGLDHISIVTAASTHSVVLAWLGKTVDSRIGKTPVNADTRLHWMLLGFLAALLAVIPILKLLSLLLRLPAANARLRTSADTDAAEPITSPAALLETESPLSSWERGLGGEVAPPTRNTNNSLEPRIKPHAEKAANRLPRWLGLIALPVALALALLALRWALPTDFWAPDPFPFTFLRQQVSADVAIYFLFAGIALLGLIWFIPRLRAHLTFPTWREFVGQAFIAALITAFLSVTLGALSSYSWESLALEPQRLWRGAVYALMLWPFFFGLRSLLYALGPRLKRPALADIGAGLLMIVALVGAIVMNFGRLSYLGILLPIVGIMILLLAGVATASRLTLKHPVVLTATLEAFLLAWILSATLPLVA